MDYLIRHVNDSSVSGYPDSLTWSALAMHYASEIDSELRPKPHSRNAIVSTLHEYAYYIRFADLDRCIYANTPELYLISSHYALNIAVYQVDPDSSQHYTLIQSLAIQTTLQMWSICSFMAVIINASSLPIDVILLSMTH